MVFAFTTKVMYRAIFSKMGKQPLFHSKNIFTQTFPSLLDGPAEVVLVNSDTVVPSSFASLSFSPPGWQKLKGAHCRQC